jgi:formate-dependent phosphoribosylglycinamide formyltransferase (GAR transformylase)
MSALALERAQEIARQVVLALGATACSASNCSSAATR